MSTSDGGPPHSDTPSSEDLAPLKILHLIRSTNPEYGGQPEGMRQLSAALVAEGQWVEVACVDPPESSWLREFPWTTHGLGPPRGGSYHYSKKLRPWLRANANRFDCLIVHGVWPYSTLATWLTLRNGCPPYYLLPHGELDPSFRHLFPRKHLKKSIYWRLAGHRILRDARAVIYHCEQERRLAGSAFKPYACREVTVNYGTTGPPGNAEKLRVAFLARFPELSGKRLLLFLSRIHPVKGADLLIEAFARLVDRDPALHLVVVGPGEPALQSTLRQRASDLGLASRVSWIGILLGDAKWGAFYAADALLLPSHHENFGLVVAEALACGLPVLISNKVNIWEEILTDGAGFVDEDDLGGTASTLSRWLDLGPDERCAMRQRARACYLNRFQMQCTAQSLVRMLRDHGAAAR